MQLVEQGKLRLDQPAGEILPSSNRPRCWKALTRPVSPELRPAKRPITVRHLLTHTSGYTYSIWSENLSRYEKVTGMPDIGYSMNGAFQAPLEFDPGDHWQYGISMDWVGKLVEAVTDQSLEVYFREHIFAPLGMSNTGFLISSEQKARVATMYNREADGSLKSAPFEINQRPEFSWAVADCSARPVTTWSSCKCFCMAAHTEMRRFCRQILWHRCFATTSAIYGSRK